MNTFSSLVLTINAHSSAHLYAVKIRASLSSGSVAEGQSITREGYGGGPGRKKQPLQQKSGSIYRWAVRVGKNQNKLAVDVWNRSVHDLWRSDAGIPNGGVQ